MTAGSLKMRSSQNLIELAPSVIAPRANHAASSDISQHLGSNFNITCQVKINQEKRPILWFLFYAYRNYLTEDIVISHEAF